MEELKQLMMEGFAKLGTEINGIKTEMGEMKTEINGIKTEMGEMKTEINGMKTEMGEMGQSQVRMEHKLDTNLGALYDARELIADELIGIRHTTKRIEDKLDKTELMARRGNYFMDKIAINR